MGIDDDCIQSSPSPSLPHTLPSSSPPHTLFLSFSFPLIITTARTAHLTFIDDDVYYVLQQQPYEFKKRYLATRLVSRHPCYLCAYYDGTQIQSIGLPSRFLTSPSASNSRREIRRRRLFSAILVICVLITTARKLLLRNYHLDRPNFSSNRICVPVIFWHATHTNTSTTAPFFLIAGSE